MIIRKDKLVILDFDHTLFNTELFKNHLKSIFTRYGISSKRYDETYDYIRYDLKRLYDPALQVRLLDREINDMNGLMGEVNVLVDHASDYLYDDVISFLESVKDECELYLVSLGMKRFQKPKIDNCRINGYFSRIVITEGVGGTKGEIFKDLISENRARKIAVIEDIPVNLDYLKRGFPNIIAIKIERVGGKYSEEKSEFNDFTIKTLSKAANIIKSVL